MPQDTEPFAQWASFCLNFIAGTADQLKTWKSIIPILIETYAKHGFTAHLGSGLVKSLSNLQKTFLNEDGLRLWRDVWQSAGEKHADLKIALRVFSAGIDYLIKPEERVLLRLSKEEREILREALQLK